MAVLDVHARRDAALRLGARARGLVAGRQHDAETEESLVAPAQQRQRAMRRDVLHEFSGVEIVGELGALFFLAGHDSGLPLAAFPHHLAQPADQFRILGELLHENPARAFKGSRHVGNPLLCVHIGGRYSFGILRRVLPQPESQRLEAGFARHLPFRAALGLVGEVEILQPGLGVGVANQCGELRRQLALFLDALEDRGAAIFEIAQVAEPFLERTQLDIVEAAGGFLTVTRDERDSGLVVEERDGGVDLAELNVQGVGDTLRDRGHLTIW